MPTLDLQLSTRKLSLTFKFILLTAIVLTATMSVTTILVIKNQTELIENHLHDKGKLLGDFVSLISPEAILSYDLTTLDSYMREAASQTDIDYAVIISSSGRNLTSINSDISASSSEQLDADEVIAFFDHMEKNNNIDNMNFPIYFNGSVIGTVHIGLSKKNLIHSTKLVLYKQILGNIFIILFLSTCIYFVFRFNTLKPIQLLTDASQRISQGNLDMLIEINTKDELGVLSKSFNQMIKKLKESNEKNEFSANQLQELNKTLEHRVKTRTRELEESEARIQAVINNMGEGVITFNEQCELTSANMAAKKIFQLEESLPKTTYISDLFGTQFDDMDETMLIRGRCQIECKGMRSNGTIVPIEVTLTTMNIADEKIRVCLVRDISQRVEAQLQLDKVQKQLVESAHKSGMAEMAVGVLHNIGNILNSVSLSAEEITRVVSRSKIQGLNKANDLLKQHIENVSDFITNDERGKKLPEYYLKLGEALDEENKKIMSEVHTLTEKTVMMKEVISTQQEYAKAESLIQSVDISSLIEDAIKVQSAALSRSGVNINRDFEDGLHCEVHKSKLLQVITNLIKNSNDAMKHNDDHNKTKELLVKTSSDESYVQIEVLDNGSGIDTKNIKKIFSHGFTTKNDGHGFGLHASANAMTEMNGKIEVQSDGLQKGSRFTISIPMQYQQRNQEN